MVHNTHLLLHLSRDLYLFGPSWTHMMFRFEGFNHLINNSIHTGSNFEKGAILDFNMNPIVKNMMEEQPNNDTLKGVVSDFENIRKKERGLGATRK